MKMYFIILFRGHRSFLKNCYVLLTERRQAYASWINLEYVKKFNTALNRQKRKEGGGEEKLQIEFSNKNKRERTFSSLY